MPCLLCAVCGWPMQTTPGGFIAKLAGAGCSHPHNLADENHPIRAQGTHAPPEVFSEVRAAALVAGVLPGELIDSHTCGGKVWFT